MSRNQHQDREAVLQVCKRSSSASVLVTLSLRAGKYSNILSVYTGLNKSFILITEDHTASKSNAADHNAFPKRVLGGPHPKYNLCGMGSDNRVGNPIHPTWGSLRSYQVGLPAQSFRVQPSSNRLLKKTVIFDFVTFPWHLFKILDGSWNPFLETLLCVHQT